jgi:DNA-directed RNA polymerase subunit omega
LLVIPDNVDSKYRFVILAALRARQIQSGSAPMVDDDGRKATTVARQELVEGLVEFTFADQENLFKK